MSILSLLVTMAFWTAVVRIGIPYILAALGGTWSERAGVINIALEGILLSGAFCATLGAWYSHSLCVGLLAGVLGGMLLSSLYAWLTLRFSANQIVCGIAINLFADGITRLFLKVIFGSSSNSPRAFDHSSTLWLIGAMAFAVVLLVYTSHFVLYRTPLGLRLRATGEHPQAAASLGVAVQRIRVFGVLASGALAGLGGAWLAADQRQFVAGMSSGRGYIALAALILGKWRPANAAIAALLFGAAEALEISLETGGVSGLGHFGWALQMLPYLLTIVALAGFIGRATPPAALGRSGGEVTD